MNIPYYLHLDMDAFFASVEILDNPQWKGKPVIIGGNPKEHNRGVVSTASYEARKYGVHSAMPLAQAYRLCPEGIYVPGRMKRYTEISEQIMNLLKNYSPFVNQLSIDEACIELTGTELLFGPIEETAIKIKKEIKQKIGITVSMGLASTPYLAKIASEVNKPDGFFIIPYQKEKEFMLKLPIKKIWGVGEKTLKKINNAGIYTTQQIYEKPRELLQLIFGNSMGNFLYDTVRGIQVEKASPKKTKSLSTEKTFYYDLTDRNAIETVLLEFSQLLIFKLHKENYTSKTISLKIRYEDFSTLTVQETINDYIKSLEDIYEISKKLFNKKYDITKGVRLIGISIDNLENAKNIQQEVLFDFGQKKKQAVEEAILKLQSKHPEIKINKARLIDSASKIKNIFLFILSFFILEKTFTYEAEYSVTKPKAASIHSASELQPIKKNNNDFLFNYNFLNNSLKLICNGFWEGQLESTFTTTFSNHNGINSSFSMPIFKQQVDLSLKALLNDKLYFETQFSDNYNDNKITFGYKTNTKEFKISNSNITFPLYYSSHQNGYGVASSKTQSPGIYSHLEDENNKWKADFLLKYNFTKQKDALFYGTNLVTENQINISDYIYGKYFYLSSSNLINNIKDIYVEDKNGTYIDSKKIKYTKLSNSQYLIIKEKKQIIFSNTAKTQKTNNKIPNILIEFNTTLDIQNQIGTYENPSSFLGKIQTYFKSNNTQNIDLSKYSYNLIEKLNNKDVLKIQSSIGFSPFICASYYNVQTNKETDISIIHKYSEETINQYDVLLNENNINFISEDFFDKTYNEAIIKTKTEEIYFPLADKYPEFYLNIPQKSDITLSVKTYTPVTRYDIGTNIDTNTIKVYKNNILIHNYTYDEQTGSIKLSTNVTTFDKIYITWQENSLDRKNGSLAFAAGFLYNFNQDFFSDISITSLWPISPELKFATSDFSTNGFTSFTNGINYKNKNIQISNKLSLAIESINTTGKYKILSMEENIPKTKYLSNSSFFNTLQDNFELNLKDTSKINLQKENLYIKESFASKDIDISGYKIPLTYIFPKDNKPYWSTISIDTNNDSDFLSANDFSLSFKIEDLQDSQIDVYLQLGVQDKKENTIQENIPTWKITDSNYPNVIKSLDLNNNNWQIVKIKLEDKDLSHFIESQNFRIIVVSKSSSLQEKKGTISIGPYEITPKTFITEENKNFNINSSSIKENKINNLDNIDNYAQKISWNKISITDDIENYNINAFQYFKSVDFSKYKKLSFYIKYTEELITIDNIQNTNTDFLTFSLLKNKNSFTEEKALELILLKNIKNYLLNNNWNKIELNLDSKELLINNTKITSDYKLFINKTILPSSFFVSINTKDNNSFINKGSLFIDELMLEETNPYFSLQNTTDFSYNDKKDLIKINDYAFIKNPSINITTKESIYNELSSKNKLNETNISSNINAKITILDIDFSSSIDLDSANSKILQNASYNIFTQNNLFNTLSFNDSFIYNNLDNSVEKANKIKLDLNKIKIPLQLSHNTNISTNNYKNKQNANYELTSSFSIKNTQIHLYSVLDLSQYDSSSSFVFNNNLFDSLKKSYIYSYSLGNSYSNQRTTNEYSYLQIDIPFFSLSPKLSFQTKGTYFNLNETTFSDSTKTIFSLPFKINSNNFEFSWSKNGGSIFNINNGGSYKDDFDLLIKKLKKNSWYYKTFIVTDLFNLNEKEIKDYKTLYNTQLTFLSSEYNFLWKRNLFYNIKDLFLPSSFTINYNKNIRFAENNSNIDQLKFYISNTAFNLFGKTSTTKLFNWYDSEEIINSFSCVIQFPKEANINYLFTGYIQTNFYLSNLDTLNIALQTEFETNNNWQTQGTIFWKREGKSSLLYELTKLIIKNKNPTINRINGFDYSLKYNNEEKSLYQNYNISHKIELQILSFLSLNLGIHESISYTTDKAITFITSANIGGKINF